MDMQKYSYKNNQLNVEINCYIDKDNKLWFRGKEIALLLDYKKPRIQLTSMFLQMIKLAEALK